MKAKLAIITTFLATGMTAITFACNGPLPLPVPPVPINISMMDLARAKLQGYGGKSALAAAMKKLDALGRDAVGASAWRNNSYIGHMTYVVNFGPVPGPVFIPVQKNCGQDFLDNVPNDGGSGGGGGISQNGCGAPGGSTEIVGFVETSIPWSVCTPDGCSTGTYYEYEFEYGQVSSNC